MEQKRCCSTSLTLSEKVVQVCDDINCDIVGGHTAEGLELSLGFSVTGSVPAKKILKKHGAKLDQSIILTKPLGTGMILAAEMRGKAKASWIKAVSSWTLLLATQFNSRQLIPC